METHWNDTGPLWAGEKLVLHKLRFHPDFFAPFPPLCEGGVGGVIFRPRPAGSPRPGTPLYPPFQYCSARNLRKIPNLFLFIDLHKGIGERQMTKSPHNRKS